MTTDPISALAQEYLSNDPVFDLIDLEKDSVISKIEPLETDFIFTKREHGKMRTATNKQMTKYFQLLSDDDRFASKYEKFDKVERKQVVKLAVERFIKNNPKTRFLSYTKRNGFDFIVIDKVVKQLKNNLDRMIKGR